jgi:hypothetical protein
MEHDKDKVQKHIEKIKKVTSGKDIIAGIHNYCDRWCERCTHTKHCSVFQMDPRNIDEISDMDNQEFWQNLSLNMAASMEMLRQGMEKWGIDMNEIPEVEPEKHIETEAEKVTKKYSYDVMKWLESNHEYFKEVMLKESVENEAMVFAVDDAVEIITWYSMFIHVKTRRCMHTENDPFDEEEDFEFRFHDNLGSAKITLISINRSMESFSFILKYMPEKESDILHFLALLEKSKKLITKRWPTAMNFKRPGFDN